MSQKSLLVRLVSIVPAFLLAAALPASANNISIATGVSSFSLLTDTTGEITGLPLPAPVITSLGGGWTSIGGASWIGPNADQSNTTRPSTNYIGATDIYSTTFSMTGLNTATATLSGLISADDFVTVMLNGHAIFVMSGSMWTTSFAFPAFSSADFVAGLNTLTFDVTNETGGPTGLDANITITASPLSSVPEPVTALPLSLALGAMLVLVYRRRRAA